MSGKRQEVRLSADTECHRCYGEGSWSDGYDTTLCRCLRTHKFSVPRVCIVCEDTGYFRRPDGMLNPAMACRQCRDDGLDSPRDHNGRLLCRQ
jgi:DnaJ-class molecular chaperone